MAEDINTGASLGLESLTGQIAHGHNWLAPAATISWSGVAQAQMDNAIHYMFRHNATRRKDFFNFFLLFQKLLMRYFIYCKFVLS